MCELGYMNVAFLVPLDGVFAAKACSLNHCNKADPSQGFDSSETRLPSFYTALSSAQEETEQTNADLQLTMNAPLTVCKQFVRFIWYLVQWEIKDSYEQHIENTEQWHESENTKSKNCGM